MWRRAVIALVALAAAMPEPARAQRKVQQRKPADYDDTFRKYSKRFFGPAYDWKLFKAQGMTESNLDMAARSRVGARGVMQLMPSTFSSIQSENDELKWIDDPHMNIAAGIQYDRKLWLLWEADSITDHRTEFMFGSYNAGRRTLLRAQGLARRSKLDPRTWPSIRTVAPQVPRWRHKETLDYVERIRAAREGMERP
ncbi:MAG: transglycosylase SLT domain-containing protein [Cytophagaceae bacterium]|nr:transglycosylase SLT domain-containing protein [Gemmatimonadaceae bacterium]